MRTSKGQKRNRSSRSKTRAQKQTKDINIDLHRVAALDEEQDLAEEEIRAISVRGPAPLNFGQLQTLIKPSGYPHDTPPVTCEDTTIYEEDEEADNPEDVVLEEGEPEDLDEGDTTEQQLFGDSGLEDLNAATVPTPKKPASEIYAPPLLDDLFDTGSGEAHLDYQASAPPSEPRQEDVLGFPATRMECLVRTITNSQETVKNLQGEIAASRVEISVLGESQRALTAMVDHMRSDIQDLVATVVRQNGVIAALTRSLDSTRVDVAEPNHLETTTLDEELNKLSVMMMPEKTIEARDRMMATIADRIAHVQSKINCDPRVAYIGYMCYKHKELRVHLGVGLDTDVLAMLNLKYPRAAMRAQERPPGTAPVRPVASACPAPTGLHARGGVAKQAARQSKWKIVPN